MTTVDQTPYEGLTPEVVLAAVESVGLFADGRLLSLNSYENRVYRVGVEASPDGTPAQPLVAKFYRAGRWSDAQIREEHAFAAELAAAELPVAAPLRFADDTLHRWQQFRFTLFPCLPGTAPDLDLPGHRALLGRTLGRMHGVGARRPFAHRSGIAAWRHGARAREQILRLGIVPPPVEGAYAEASARLVEAIAAAHAAVGPVRSLRLHGDCHPGNILWQQSGPLFVDFDDCLMGPPVQDLWLFAAGDPAQMRREWNELVDGYEQFAHLDAGEAGLIEALRGQRMLNHAAWLATRWNDPAFPRAFPWFGEPRFWERHVNELREQLEALEDPPLLRY